jgi:hypothetical protein
MKSAPNTALKGTKMVHHRNIGVAVCIGSLCFGLAVGVGNYLGFGNDHIWFYKVIHVAAGYALAMFFAALGFSLWGVCIGVILVSGLWELYEYLLVSSELGLMLRRWLPWHALPIVSTRDLVLDYIWNFSGVLLFYLSSLPARSAVYARDRQNNCQR